MCLPAPGCKSPGTKSQTKALHARGGTPGVDVWMWAGVGVGRGSVGVGSELRSAVQCSAARCGMGGAAGADERGVGQHARAAEPGAAPRGAAPAPVPTLVLAAPRCRGLRTSVPRAPLQFDKDAMRDSERRQVLRPRGREGKGRGRGRARTGCRQGRYPRRAEQYRAGEPGRCPGPGPEPAQPSGSQHQPSVRPNSSQHQPSTSIFFGLGPGLMPTSVVLGQGDRCFGTQTYAPPLDI